MKETKTYLIILLCFFLYGFPEGLIAENLRENKIVLLIDDRYEPYSFKNAKGQPDGFDVDLMKAICKEQNIDLEIHTMRFSKVREYVLSDTGNYVAVMLKTPERDENLEYSKPLTEFRHSLFVEKESDIENLKDIKNKTVLVQEGDVMHDYLIHHNIPCNIETAENQLVALERLDKENFDVALAAKMQGEYFINKYNLDNIKPTGKSFHELKYCYATSPVNGEIISEINQGITRLKENGTYEDIYSKWFGFFQKGFMRTIYFKEILIVVLIVLIIIVSVLLWNYTLRKAVDKNINQLRTELEKNKQIQKQLRESEEKYRLLAETANEIILIHDFDGNIKYVNKRTSKYLGYTKEQLINMNIKHLVVSENISELKERFKKRKRGDQNMLTYELEVISKNKKRVPFEVTSVPITSNGETHILVTGRDISERQEYEKQLIEAKEKAEENDRLKSAFLANLSHEIRTPLNSIMGFSTVLQRKDFPVDDMNKYLKMIHVNGQQLLHIINDLVEFSMLESDNINIQLRELNVQQFMDDLITKSRKKISGNHLIVDSVQDINSQHEVILADTSRLQQILDNLINNSIKYTTEGQITISCTSTAEDELTFCVSDTGRGIHPDEQEMVFERFRQGSVPYGGIQSGTGLGLSIARSMVHMLGGKIWLKSALNKGTNVYFTIPAEKKEENEPKTAKQNNTATAKQDQPSFQKQILIVEDEDSNYLFLEAVLKREDHIIHRATDGAEALEIFGRLKDDIDLIFMDLKLPRMNGLEVTRKIKAMKPDVPVIAQTAYAMSGDKAKALDAGCDDYIAKPISREELIRKIKEFTG